MPGNGCDLTIQPCPRRHQKATLGLLLELRGLSPVRTGLGSTEERRTMSCAKAGFLSPSAAAHIAKRARKLHRLGLITHAQMAVLDVLLWDMRKPGSDTTTVTYNGLCKLAAVCRQTVADAVAAFERLGLLRRIKCKVLVLWANNGRKWRQQANEYVFTRCESGAQTEYPKEEIRIHILQPSPAETREAQARLAAVADIRRTKLGLG